MDKKLKWFGCAGHFILGDIGDKCRFHLCTQVGKYLVSTIGELWLERTSREIHAQVYDNDWLEENKHLLGDEFDYAYMKKFGYEKVGCDRLFETMVFKAGKPCNSKGCNCGQPSIDGSELDFLPANLAGVATLNHFKLIKKWGKK